MAVDVGIKRLRHYWPVYLLIVLPFAGILLFNYYPIYNGIKHIFYRWDGDQIEEFVAFQNIVKMARDAELWRSFRVVLIFILANLVKMIPPIMTAVVIHHLVSGRAQYVYRVLFVIPMIVPMLLWVLLWKYFYEPNFGAVNTALRALGILEPTESIGWLTNKGLIIPSLIFQGFPWVGAFGVLIYLAGLQNIPSEVYEAAYIDGAGAWKVFRHVEVPLITTQIRINLVLMMIHTVQGWQNIYLMLGESGGRDGVATVPGLYVFRESFRNGYMGYGCAIGFLLFLITLGLTYINNKYARVKK
jgi:raffinose/stachyose/melibiose transport system permease protein